MKVRVANFVAKSRSASPLTLLTVAVTASAGGPDSRISTFAVAPSATGTDPCLTSNARPAGAKCAVTVASCVAVTVVDAAVLFAMILSMLSVH